MVAFCGLYGMSWYLSLSSENWSFNLFFLKTELKSSVKLFAVRE